MIELILLWFGVMIVLCLFFSVTVGFIMYKLAKGLLDGTFNNKK